VTPRKAGPPAGNREAQRPEALVEGRLAPSSDILGEIMAIAAAGRRVVARGDLTHRERLLVILELAERSRASAWPYASAHALWAGIKHFLGEADEPDHGADPVEQALARLHRRGYDRCPECRRPILAGQIERQRILRHSAVDEALRREQEARRAS
jgi:hypothetical protein